MSKQVGVQVKCGRCGHSYQASIYKSIWGEYAENRAIVFNDSINVCVCPVCRDAVRAPMSMLYTQRERGFAVWYEPCPPDPQIDRDTQGYASLFSPPDNFYVTAPRVADWAQFKETIREFEAGVRHAKPATPALAGLAKQIGCVLPLLVLAAALAAASSRLP